MIQSKLVFLLAAASLATAALPVAAQTAPPAARHARKPRPKPTLAPTAPSGGINTPAADFSTLEGPDDAAPSTGPGSSMRPVMGAGGNIGLGTGF